MKNKLPKKAQQPIKPQDQLEEQEEQKQIQQKVAQEISLKPRMIKKDSLYVHFSGLIESGKFDQFRSLYLYYTIATGPDWKKLNGNSKGFTQIGSCDDEKIVWNFPFEATYQSTYLAGWPQIIIVLYGYDFFGRAYVKGYGNTHLPTSGGLQKRRMRIFCPEPRSIISGILGYFQGTIAQYRDVQRVVALGDGRQVTRTKSVGYVDLKIQTTKYNFTKFGYQ